MMMEEIGAIIKYLSEAQGMIGVVGYAQPVEKTKNVAIVKIVARNPHVIVVKQIVIVI